METILNGHNRLLGGGSTGSSSPQNCSALNQHTDDVTDPIAAFYFILLALSLGVMTLYTQTAILGFVPYSCKMFVQGIALGMIHIATGNGLGHMSDSVTTWSNIDPHLLVTLFLPILVFCDSMKIDIHLLRKCFWQCCILAGPGVGISATVMASFARLFLGWEWYLCFTFGATIAATGPIAVVTLLEPIGASHKLSMIMAGESHMGDLLMLLLFELFLNLTLKAEYGAVQLVEIIATMAFGGTAFGLAVGLVAHLIIRSNADRTSRRSILIQITITICTSYISFIVAESFFNSNGVIATFSSAVVIAAFSWPVFASRSTVANVWASIEYIANTLVFVLAGVIVGKIIMEEATGSFKYQTLVDGVMLYLCLLGTRIVMVGAMFPILKKLGYGLSKAEGVIVAWGGLRGAVSLTLAIVVRNELQSDNRTEEGSDFVFLVSTVVFLMLLVNGSTAKPLLRQVGLLRKPQVKKQLLDYVDRQFRAKAAEAYEKVRSEPKYNNHDETVVVKHITALQRTDDQNNMNGILSLVSSRLQDVPNDSATATMVELETDDSSSRRRSERSRSAVDSVSNSKRPRTILENSKPSERMDAKELEHEENLKAQVRELFLSALRAAYWDQIVQGVIPKGSRPATRLLRSVERALDNKHTPLDDFQSLHLPSTESKFARPKHIRFLEWLVGLRILPQHLLLLLGEWIHAEVIGDGVYVASCLIDAHGVAQEMFTSFVGKEFEDSPQIQFVLHESDDEVAEAKRYLMLAKASDPNIVEFMQNKKVASIVLEKQKQFATKMLKEGVLEESAYYELLLHIRHDLKHLKKMKAAIAHKETSLFLKKDEKGRKAFGFRRHSIQSEFADQHTGPSGSHVRRKSSPERLSRRQSVEKGQQLPPSI